MLDVRYVAVLVEKMMDILEIMAFIQASMLLTAGNCKFRLNQFLS
jgi:hypothetical protein